MARIAVGGFHHETNTFAPSVAAIDDFIAADAWPGLCYGDDVFKLTHGINLAVSGFSGAAKKMGHELVGLLWCAAPPSGPVTSDAFETIMRRMLARIKDAGDIDAVFLDLHGAMVSEKFSDGDGEILKRIRGAIGANTPIVVALDFHANISPKMCSTVDGMVVYRTYPHVDMEQTGERAANILSQIIIDKKKRHVELISAPFLVPLTWQATTSEPAKDIYARLSDFETNGVDAVSLAMGFPPADVFDCGPAVVVSGSDIEMVKKSANDAMRLLVDHEKDFAGIFYTPDDALLRAKEIIAKGKLSGPIILADTQDNPGGGGDGDTTGLLKAMIKAGIDNSVMGIFAEPIAVQMATHAGTDNSFEMDFGSRKHFAGDTPLHATFKVLALGGGSFMAEGPFYAGAKIDLGPMALLETGGVKIVVSSKKQQAADRAMFGHLGIDVNKCAVLGLKSSVHFRADFEKIASDILIVEAPGANTADPRNLDYKNIRPNVKRFPEN
ncbi:MAG: M81 family metallopeptidase [Rhodospirillaceae bacterium]|nr:M81 family metallopeptidase [Rhodospirillaceae bacterium]